MYIQHVVTTFTFTYIMQVSISWSSTLFCLLTTSVVQVVDFYSSSIAIQKLDAHRIALISSVVAFLSALLSAVVLWYFGVPMAHKLSAGVVIGAVFFIMATPTLTRPPPRSSQNTLIGYSVTGLPLYQSHRSGPSLMDYVRPSLQKIMENPDSRRIFYFLLLNLVRLKALTCITHIRCFARRDEPTMSLLLRISDDLPTFEQYQRDERTNTSFSQNSLHPIIN